MGEDIPCILSAIIYCSMKLIFHRLLFGPEGKREREREIFQVVFHLPLHRLKFIPNGSQISLNYHIISSQRQTLKDQALQRIHWNIVASGILYCHRSTIFITSPWHILMSRERRDSMNNNWCAFDRPQLVQHIPHFKTLTKRHLLRHLFHFAANRQFPKYREGSDS